MSEWLAWSAVTERPMLTPEERYRQRLEKAFAEYADESLAIAREQHPVAPALGLPPFLTVKEVAALLRVGRWSVYEAVKSGEIKAIHVGRSVRIPRSAIEGMLGDDE